MVTATQRLSGFIVFIKIVEITFFLYLHYNHTKYYANIFDIELT